MTREGEIIEQWAGKSVIRSCAKLAYGNAQEMIEGTFRGLEGETAPTDLQEPHTWEEVWLAPGLLISLTCGKILKNQHLGSQWPRFGSLAKLPLASSWNSSSPK